MNPRKNSVRIALAVLLTFAFGGRLSLAQGSLPGQPPAAGGSAAGGAAPLDAATYSQQLSYMLGQNIGNDLRENQVAIDMQSLIAGVTDGLSGAKSRLTDAQLAACQQRFSEEMRSRATNRMQQAAEQNSKQAAAFLAQNAKQPGVQTTPSGLQYKVLAQGNGPTPGLTDTVRCHYRGTLIDGTEFDTSIGGEPAQFPVNQVIGGWTEALQEMHVGDKWQLFVPADLAYGQQPPPGSPIGPNSLLIFEVELLGVDGK
jgi:FKBP-type peptidyl-prolyl cis-trans isomerase FklB